MAEQTTIDMPKSEWIMALEIAIREADRYFIRMATQIRWQQALEALTAGPVRFRDSGAGLFSHRDPDGSDGGDEKPASSGPAAETDR